jgi:L-threonylcarbamoyladenylate synthase
MCQSESPPPSNCGSSVSLAVDHLRQGRIVAFPTETYYGLAVDPENDQAVAALYRLKNRPKDKPLLLLVEKRAQLDQLVTSIPDQYLPLMENFWPGPLTLIFAAKKSLNSMITAGTGTVGVRISPDSTALSLLQSFGRPLTATSANISGKKPSSTAAEVSAMFGDRIDYILDGGPTRSRASLSSTIVGLKNGRLALLRKGQLALDQINL